MKSLLQRVCLLLALSALLFPTPAPAYILIAFEPVVQRVALADVIVVGKITAMRDKSVRARIYPRENNERSRFEFRLAEVEVTQVIAGPKDLKRLTVAFIKLQLDTAQYKPRPAEGMEACIFAVKHFDEDFYVVPQGGLCDPASRQFQSDSALIRRCASLLDDPKSGLKSAEPAQRLLTAHLLALRYNFAPLRWFGMGVQGQAVDPELGRLLLETLAAADWSKPDPDTRASAPLAVGWIVMGAKQANLPLPADFPVDQIHDAASAPAVKKYLADHAAKIKLWRLVPAKSIELPPATRKTE